MARGQSQGEKTQKVVEPWPEKPDQLLWHPKSPGAECCCSKCLRYSSLIKFDHTPAHPYPHTHTSPHKLTPLLHTITHLQWIMMGLFPVCCWVRVTWSIRSIIPAPLAGAPFSGHAVKWNCLTIREVLVRAFGKEGGMESERSVVCGGRVRVDFLHKLCWFQTLCKQWAVIDETILKSSVMETFSLNHSSSGNLPYENFHHW